MKIIEITYRYDGTDATVRPRPTDSESARARLEEGSRSIGALLDSLTEGGAGTAQRVIPRGSTRPRPRAERAWHAASAPLRCGTRLFRRARADRTDLQRRSERSLCRARRGERPRQRSAWQPQIRGRPLGRQPEADRGPRTQWLRRGIGGRRCLSQPQDLPCFRRTALVARHPRPPARRGQRGRHADGRDPRPGSRAAARLSRGADRSGGRFQCGTLRLHAATADRRGGQSRDSRRVWCLPARGPAGLGAARRQQRMRGTRLPTRRLRGVRRLRGRGAPNRTDRAPARRCRPSRRCAIHARGAATCTSHDRRAKCRWPCCALPLRRSPPSQFPHPPRTSSRAPIRTRRSASTSWWPVARIRKGASRSIPHCR